MNDKEKNDLKKKILDNWRKKITECYLTKLGLWVLNENAMWYAAIIAADMSVRATYASMDKEDKKKTPKKKLPTVDEMRGILTPGWRKSE